MTVSIRRLTDKEKERKESYRKIKDKTTDQDNVSSCI